MTGLRLFCGEQSLELALFDKPQRITAENIHRIRHTVKTDVPWSLAVPSNVFERVFGDEAASAYMPDVWVWVDGQRARVWQNTQNDTIIFTPPLVAQNKAAAIFDSSIGTLNLELTARIRGKLFRLFTEPAFLAIPKNNNADYVRAMADLVIDRLSTWRNTPEESVWLIDENDAPTLAQSLDNRLHAVERTLRTYEQQFAALKTNARFELASVDKIAGVGRLTSFTHTTLQYVIEHPEELVPANQGTGIRVGTRFYMPRRTLVETKTKVFDLPENRILLGFLVFVVSELADEVRLLKERIETLPSVAGFEDARYVTSAEAILGVAAARLSRYLEKLDGLLKHARRIVEQYRAILPVVPMPYTGIPHPTKIFSSVPAYRQIFECMIGWKSSGTKRLVNVGLLLTAFERSRLYELYCLFRLIDDLQALGFKLTEQRRFVYFAAAEARRQSPGPNTFRFEKTDASGRVIRRATLYYEPVIRASSQNRQNGIDLVRTSPFTWYAGSLDFSDESKAYFTPDYLVRIEDEKKHVRWFIADAKYSDGWKVADEMTQELVFKYLFAIRPVHANETVEGLWIFYGWTKETDERRAMPVKVDSWSVEHGPSMYYEPVQPMRSAVNRLAAQASR